MVSQNMARLSWRKKPGDLVDTDLIAAIAAGDEQALERLYRRYFRKLTGFAVRITERTEIAEEVAMDTLMAVWRGAKGYEGRSRPSTWLFGIAYRIALKARRHARKGPDTVDTDFVDDIPDAGSEKTLENMFLSHQLARAMHRLTPEHRAVIQLTYYYGYSYPEISEILDCPVGTVKSRMSHARARLAHFLIDVQDGSEERNE